MQSCHLIQSLRSDDPDQRRSAATTLAGPDIDPTEAVKALIEALDDDDQEVRFWCAEVLRRIGPAARGATSKLLPWLDSANRDTRLQAASVLAKIDPTLAPRLIEVALDAFQYGDRDERTVSTALLGDLARTCPVVRTYLKQALNDPDWAVRVSAIDAWAVVGEASEEVLQEIHCILMDENEFVRDAAREALAKITSEQSRP